MCIRRNLSLKLRVLHCLLSSYLFLFSTFQSKLSVHCRMTSHCNIEEYSNQFLHNMINYCVNEIPNIPNILAHLHQLLRKGAKWEWTSKQEQAQKESKEQLNTPKVLVDFVQNKAVTVACDASPYGLGTVLSHIMEDGSERPIVFVSRTLTPAEKNCS